MGIEFIRQTQLVVCRRPFCGSAECLVDCLQRYFRIIIFSFLRCLLANTVTPIFHLPAGWSGREWLCTLLCRTRIEVVIYCSENYCSRDAKANRNHNRALSELLLFAAGDVVGASSRELFCEWGESARYIFIPPPFEILQQPNASHRSIQPGTCMAPPESQLLSPPFRHLLPPRVQSANMFYVTHFFVCSSSSLFRSTPCFSLNQRALECHAPSTLRIL